MTQYEQLTTIEPTKHAMIDAYALPEIVHDDDPATNVMHHFSKTRALRVKMDDTINTITHELKSHDAHALLVVKSSRTAVGIITSEDVFGEKPVQIAQQSRIPRQDISANLLMTPLYELLTLNISDVQHALVGNIIATLTAHHAHYALVVSMNKSDEQPQLEGLFHTPQIIKQLHRDITTL